MVQPDNSDCRGIRRIVIVGISGTGKSRLGVTLAEKTGLTLHQMDSLIWGPDWMETPADHIRAALARISTQDNWIVEGWIDHYSQDILRRSDAILYLDYPGWLAAYGALRRWFTYRGRTRPEMPAGCTETLDAGFLRTLLLRKERPHIERMLHDIPQTTIIRVRSRQATQRLLSDLVCGVITPPGAPPATMAAAAHDPDRRG